MLASLTGQLEAVCEDRAQVRIGPLVIDVYLPAATRSSLEPSVGSDVTLHTLLVLEASGQGASMTPRVLGFGSTHERAFFELFTTVKNIGHRKALRALEVPVADVAAAIARRDVAFLVGLPEIGRRTAETIIAELSGKVDAWSDGPVPTMASDEPQPGSLAADALAMLVALGERPETARRLIDQAMRRTPEIESAEALLAEVMATRTPGLA